MVGHVLGVEGAEIARVASAHNLALRLGKYGLEKGWIGSAEMLKNPVMFSEYVAHIGEAWGEDLAKIVQHEGVVPLKLVPGAVAPKHLADEINRLFDSTMDNKSMGKVAALYGKSLGIWKAHQLALFLSYHSRNLLSNVWNNYLAGMGDDPRDWLYYKRAKDLQLKFWRASKHPEIMDKILEPEELKLYNTLKDRGIMNTGEFVGELGDIVDPTKTFKSVINPRNWINPKKNWLIQKGFEGGRTIENNSRIAHYLWATEKKGLSEADAVRSVNKYLFDYRGGLTGFETKWMRNGLVPFYAWTRFNLPLQLEMLAQYPAKYAGIYKAKRAWESEYGGTEPNQEFLEDWMKHSTSVRWKWNKDKGTYEYFMFDSWWPGADVNKVLSIPIFRDTLLSMLSPLVKVPLELLFNYDTFRKRPINEFAEGPYPIKGATGGIHVGIPFTKIGTEIRMDPRAEFTLKHIRYVADLDRWFSTQKDVSVAGRSLRMLLGRAYPHNPAKAKERYVRDIGVRISRLKYMEKMAIRDGDTARAADIRKKIKGAQAAKDHFD